MNVPPLSELPLDDIAGHHNSCVIQEVKDLAEELASLWRDNRLMRESNDQLKRHNDEMRLAYSVLSAEYESIRADSHAAEVLFEEHAAISRKEIEMRRQQFEEAHKCILRPQEIEKLRQQLLEELELPTREAMNELEYEVEDATQSYAKAVRALRSLRAQHDVEVARLLSENESLRRDHSQELRVLHKELRVMEDILKLKSQEVKQLEKQLRDSTHVLARDDALATQSNLRKLAVLAAEKAEERLAAQISLTGQLERRLSSTVAQITVREDHIERLMSSLNEAESHKVILLRKVETDQRRHLEEVKRVTAHANLAIAELKARFDVERVEAANATRSISLKLTSHEDCLKIIQDECDRRARSAEASSRRAHQSATASKLESDLKLDASATELIACKSELLKASGETEGLRRALAAMDGGSGKQLPTYFNLLEQCKSDLKREQLRVVELRNALHLIKTQNFEFEAAISALDNESRKLLMLLEQSKIAHAKETMNLKHKWHADRRSFLKRVKKVAVICETRRRTTSRKAKRKITRQQRRMLSLSPDPVLARLDSNRSTSRQGINVYTTNSVLRPAPMEFSDEFVALEKRQIQFVHMISSDLK